MLKKNTDKDDLNQWLDSNKAQRKALNTMLNSIENEKENTTIEQPDMYKNLNKNTNKNLNIMNIISQFFKKLGVLILPILLAGSMNLHAQDNGFVPGKIRIKIENESVDLLAKSLSQTKTDGQFKTGLNSIDKLNKKFGATKMKRVFPYAGKNEGKHIKHDLHLWYEINVDSEEDLLTIVNNYKNNDEIITSEPILIKVLNYNVKEAPFIDSAKKGAAYSTDDVYINDQWHYNNDGSIPNSIAGSDINLFEAWEITKGNPNVVVAIVDGGIDINHVDLKANLWVNEAEFNGEPGVDDDNNGYIDDIHGYNFADHTNEIEPRDHGTHVAGTVAAVSNNGKGVAGVAGGSGNNDGVKIMSCQVFSTRGGGSFSEAIVYGADNGALISQNSWGVTVESEDDFDQVVLDAIDYFNEEAGNTKNSLMKGGIVVFAAGNENADEMHYPAYYESTIAVSAMGIDFTKASYSSYGDYVDITAPGGEGDWGDKAMILSTLVGNAYGYMNGTSMATPHVAGIAALVISKFGSSSFTNTELKQRLLSGTKNIDVYNPNYIGKMGIGFIDAAMTLAEDDKVAPSMIDDLAIIGTSQDFVIASWSVPIDAGDGTPFKYILKYAKDASFEDAKSVEVDNNYKNSGDVIEQIVTGLEPITTYYLTVESIDRWGNVSIISNIVETTTNRGPDISTDVSNIKIDIDILEGTEGVGQFKIQNNDEGVLDWTAMTREVDNTPDLNKINFPEKGKSITINELNVQKEAVVLIEKFKSNVISTDAWEKETLGHTNSVKYTIGDLDSTVTNSSATGFAVTSESGFNLTQISSYLKLDKEDGPAVLQVYKDNIHKENLLYVTDEIEAYFEENYTHTLKEQIFFEQGDVIWIVYHIPKGNLFPLGMGVETLESGSDNCFYSSNLGETWEPLAGVIEADFFAWTVFISSNIEHLDKYVTLDPNEGSIAGVGHEDIAVNVDVSKLINGNYQSNIVIQSNDEDTPFERVRLEVNVAGHKPVLSSTNILDFGNVFDGTSSTKEMIIKNNGYGRFKTRRITSSNSQFKVDTRKSELNIPALGEKPLVITFKANGTGNRNSVITLTSYNGDVYTFNVFAVSAEPSKILVEKTQYNFDNVSVGDDLSDIIKITNTGKYPLEFGFPIFTDDLSHIENLPENIQRFGYTMEKSGYPTDYVFNDISQTGIEITDFFKENITEKSYKVDIGFDFPFFGETLNELFISKMGMLTIDDDYKLYRTPRFHGEGLPNGYIAAFLAEFSFKKGGSVFYKNELGKLIVQYSDVRTSRDSNDASITFQIEIYNNGDINFIYDKFDNISDLKYNYSAVENIEKTDGVLINSVVDGVFLPHRAHQIVNIHSPGYGMIKSVVEAKGIIQPGENVELVMTVDKDKLFEGTFKEYISVISNDPFNSSQIIEINIDVVRGGSSELEIDPSSVVFNDVFQYTEFKGVVAVKNNGTKQTTVSSISFENGQVIYNGEQNIDVGPNQTMYINYEVVSSKLGEINDVLTIVDIEGLENKVPFTGNIVVGPEIQVIEESYDLAMAPDSEIIKNFTVKNVGQSNLEFAIATTEHVSIVEGIAPDLVPEFTYVYRSTFDEEDKPSYQWLNLGLEDKVEFHVAQQIFYEEIELPFEFEFYQEKYTKVMMGTQGLLSFDENVDLSKAYLVPPPIPTDDELNNFIAPYFAGGGPNIGLPDNEWGRFYKAYDDKVVFEWRAYSSIFGLGGNYSFQAILYKNGTIKYQYKARNSKVPIKAQYGLIGIENKDGTDALQIAYVQEYFEDGVAVEIFPAIKHTLVANGSKDFDLNFSTVDVNAGEYSESIRIISNDPVNQNLNVPIKINVSGEAAFKFDPEVMDIGDYVIKPEDKYHKEFVITNTGKRIMSVNNLRLEDNTTGYIEYQVLDDRLYLRWVRLDDPNYSFLVEPDFKSEKFRLTIDKFIPNDSYTNKILADTDYGTTEELPVSAFFKLPPVFTVNDESIYHMANNYDLYTHTLHLGNVEGSSNLDYILSLNFERNDLEAAKVVTSKNEVQPELLKNKLFTGKKLVTAAKLDDTFANVLSHDDQEESTLSLGFGNEVSFTTSTEFVALQNGFNLSHVQTWYMNEDFIDSEIKVEIRVGTVLETAKIIHTETFIYTAKEANSGSLITFKLNNVVKLLPYEKFFVIFSYPLGVGYPQGVVDITKLVKDRYKYEYSGSWYDLVGSQLEYFGWMVRAAEETQSEMSWISFNGETEGSIGAGQTYDLVVELHPEKTSSAINNATIKIETNDYEAKRTTIPVTLKVNQGPELIVENKYTVNETETLNVNFMVTDNEGDGIVYVALALDYENASLTYKDGVANFIYSPTYDDAGYHTFKVYTEDGIGVKAKRTITVEVVDLNRAPLANEMETIVININDDDYRLDLEEVFSDPDGDTNIEFTYTFSDEDIVEAYLNDNVILIEPIELGVTNLTITGIDSKGAITNNEIKVVVTDRIDNDEFLKNNWIVNPNPVDSEMIIEVNTPIVEEINISIINALGITVGTFISDEVTSSKSFPVDDLEPGIYFVELKTKEAKSVRKIVKN